MRFPLPICGLVVLLTAVSFEQMSLAQAPPAGTTPPSIIVRNEPEYSAEAARARVQFTVVLSIVVGEDGKARDVHVAQGAGFGLDEKAIEAIGTWVFKPGTKDGHAVPMPANVEMNFHLQVRGDADDHSGQFARLNFTLPPGASHPELIAGKLPGNPAAAGDQALRFHLQVDMEGVPKNIAVLGSTDQVWQQQALRVIRAWRFRPASVDGVAVPVEGVFELAHSAPPESDPVIVEQPESGRSPRRAFVPIQIGGLIERGNHTATRLTNGTVLLAGGMAPGLVSGGAHRMAKPAQIFDPVTRTIANTGYMLTARANHTATLLKDGTVLIAGGYAGGHNLVGAEIFDPSTGEFSATGSMHEARSSHAAALLPDGRVLICGGVGMDGNALASAEIYNPRVKAFVPAGTMTAPRASFSAVTLKDGRVLLVGGAGAAVEIFNPESGAFSSTGNMTTARAGLSATLLENGQILVAGGNSAEIFNPVTNAFRASGALAEVRDRCAAVLLNNGEVLITGGSPQTEIYDTASGTSSPGPLLTAIHSGYTATLLEDGSVLVAGSSVAGEGSSVELLKVR